MTENNQSHEELFEGLRALAESAFPKKCANYGPVFESADQFLLETVDIERAKTSLKQAEEEDGTKIIEVFRNCPCGSTLMDFFSDRRDTSEKGAIRRNKFDELVVFLNKNGIDNDVARMELLKVLRGGKSEILSKIVTTHPAPKFGQ